MNTRPSALSDRFARLAAAVAVAAPTSSPVARQVVLTTTAPAITAAVPGGAIGRQASVSYLPQPNAETLRYVYVGK
jgi:hypothetical protein